MPEIVTGEVIEVPKPVRPARPDLWFVLHHKRDEETHRWDTTEPWPDKDVVIKDDFTDHIDEWLIHIPGSDAKPDEDPVEVLLRDYSYPTIWFDDDDDLFHAVARTKNGTHCGNAPTARAAAAACIAKLRGER